jgi:molybdopterin-guanine dinucleotide biosynthesis protein A
MRSATAPRPGDLRESVGILILAGGEATRLPGKLGLAAGDVPLVVRVYRNFAVAERETFVSCNATFAPELDALLPVPAVIDRWARRGPLAGMLSTMPYMRSRFIFAVAGDAPFASPEVLDALLAALRPGDEAVVPEHVAEGTRRLEPLAALYDRLAFLRAGLPILRQGRGSLLAVIEALRTRFVPARGGETFINVNTPADYAALLARLGEHQS